MRVAIVQETVAAARGGAETSTREMAAALNGLGVDVTVVSRDERPGHADTTAEEPRVIDGVKYERLPAAGGNRLARAIHFVRAADEYCHAGGFDIVHAISPCFSANVYQPRGGTYVETVRRNLAAEPTSLHRVLKWVDRRLNRRQRFLMLLERDLLSGTRPPVVAALSAYVKRQVVEQYPAAAAETHVVFNGVDVAPPDRDQADRARGALRAMLGVPETTRVALFVAHNFKLKGLRELLRAWRWVQREAPADDVALLIVGNGKRQTYERQARALGVDRAIHFLSGQTEMPALYAGADILVHPTWYDPCSRVVLEALSYGLPTVTTRWNGAAEWLDEPAQGAVIDSPADQRALAAAVLRCLDAETRTTAQAAAEAFRERASMRRHAEELVALYEHVCAKRRGR